MSLDIKAIIKGLSDTAKEFDVKAYACVDSTNTVAKRMGMKDNTGNSIIISEMQTNGRGRNGNSFFSPDSTGLYLSLLLKDKLNLIDVNKLTAVCAVAVMTAINKLSERKASIKWINDILIDGKKVAGILVEPHYENNMKFVVIGIGVNVFKPAKGFPVKIIDKASYIFNEKLPLLRERLAIEIINESINLIFKAQDDICYSLYRSNSVLIGKNVIIYDRKQKKYFQATVVDVDKKYRLIVRCDNNEIKTVEGLHMSIYKSGEA